MEERNERQRAKLLKVHMWVFGVLGAIAASTKLGSLDLPLMLANGAVILDQGTIPRTNVFSWANPDHAYLNDKWLFMAIVALVERVGGTAALALLKCALGATVGVLVGRLMNRLTRAGVLAGGLAVLMFAYRMHLRAEMFSMIGLLTTLLALPHIRRGDRVATVVFLVTMPLWAATHGYWVLGPLVLFVSAAATRCTRTALVGAGALAASAISPFGVSNLVHPFRVLTQLGGDVLPEAITELRTPFIGDAPWTAFHVLAAALVVVGLIAVVVAVRRRNWEIAALTVLLLVVGTRIDRNLALLGALPLITAPLVASFRAKQIDKRWKLIHLILWPIAFRFGLPAEVEMGWGKHDGRHPVEVAARAGADRPGTRYVNDFSIGSFLVNARGRAFIDGNTEGYSHEFLADYRAWLSGDRTLDELDARYPNDGYLLRHGAPHTRVMILGLFVAGEAAPVDHDDVATLFRRDVEAEFVDAEWFHWLRDVYLPKAAEWFAEPVDLGDDVTIAQLRAALEQSPYHAPYYVALARAYSANGEHASAARCRRLASRLSQ